MADQEMRRFGFRGSLAAAPFAARTLLPGASEADLGRATSPARPHAGDPARGAEGLGIGRLDAPKAERAALIDISETRIQSLPLREQSLAKFMLAQDELRRALTGGPGLELRATGDEFGGFLFPSPWTFEISSSDAAEARATVRGLNDELSTILLHNLLQFLPETRQFLGLCFTKLRVGGTLIVTVPHQFLYERKFRLPSRRNRSHRRFYTANTLLADIEEAIDPCQYRIRFLGENDAGYEYVAGLSKDVDGGQDIVVAIEKLARPAWRSEVDEDEITFAADSKPQHVVELASRESGPIRIIAPDRHGVDRVILLKLDHRSDFLLATEAFKVLREAYGAAYITLICGSWNVAEADISGYFDQIVAFDFFSEDNTVHPISAERLREKLSELIGAEPYDLAVDLRLDDDTREVLQAINARNRAGFDRYDSFPWLTIRLNTPAASIDDRTEAGVFSVDQFLTAVYTRRSHEIVADAPFTPREIQHLIWGPYQTLKPGRYQFECLIEPLAEDFEISFDVITDAGTRTLLAGSLPVIRAQHPRLHFNIEARVDSFEFRLVGRPSVEVKPFRFSGIRYIRPAVMRAVHQREAMALLAHLVRLRLHDPYEAALA